LYNTSLGKRVLTEEVARLELDIVDHRTFAGETLKVRFDLREIEPGCVDMSVLFGDAFWDDSFVGSKSTTKSI